VSSADHVDGRRQLWGDIALTAAFAIALVCFGAAWGFVGARISEGRYGPQIAVGIAYLITVAVLVYYAYSADDRRWYHWVIFPACALSGFLLPIPLIYLPWLIVLRRRQRA
jgi:hypothetical protein